MLVALKKDNSYSSGPLHTLKERSDICRTQQRLLVVICVAAEYFVLEVLTDRRSCGVPVSNRHTHKLILPSHRDTYYNKDRHNTLILACQKYTCIYKSEFWIQLNKAKNRTSTHAFMQRFIVL